MKTQLLSIWLCAGAACLLAPSILPAKGGGYMGGRGDVVVAEEPVIDTTESTMEESEGVPETVDGPLNDAMSDSGKLFGDLYVILRQQGKTGEEKLVPETEADGTTPKLTDGVQLFVKSSVVVGGEPMLTIADSTTYDRLKPDLLDYGWYAAETGLNPDGTPIYGAVQSPYPAQCVQPVADYERWGDISVKTQLARNRLPLVITYDATWGRSECEVGQLTGEVVADPVTGELTTPTNIWFIEPGGSWPDPKSNTSITYPDGVLWTQLVQEVHFGRLNLSRAPEAVLQAAFDEAITAINNADEMSIDAAGRLLLTTTIYDEILVDQVVDVVTKAIDSPLENLALYVKLMQDGHLVTPADERAPIDRSKNGGIPLWKLLELEDGPADAILRPTIDIEKVAAKGFGSLVDVTPVDYYTYYQCLDSNSMPTPCLCWDDAVQPELDQVLVACDNVVSRTVAYELSSALDKCPSDTSDPANPIVCEGPFTGIVTDAANEPNATDLNYAASFLAAAADKFGEINVDMVVYLNSILGINKVVDELDENGNVLTYSKNPVYYNFNTVQEYNRTITFGTPGVARDDNVPVLQGGNGNWIETPVPILQARKSYYLNTNDPVIFDDIDLNLGNSFPNHLQATTDILGFTQQSNDDLSVINFIHTYQIPELR